jgi:hypothetical protein
MTPRTASRSRRRDLKSVPDGITGSSISTLTKPVSGEPLIASKHRSCAVNDTWQDREIGFSRHLERTEIETRESDPSGESALRKEDQYPALTGKFYQCLGIDEAALNVIALDKRSAEAPQKWTCDHLSGQFSLGNDRRFAREDRGEDENVHIAGMIENQHRVSAGNTVHADGQDRDAHCHKSRAPNPSEDRPTPGEARENEYDERSQQECNAKDHPPPGCIQDLAGQPRIAPHLRNDPGQHQA